MAPISPSSPPAPVRRCGTEALKRACIWPTRLCAPGWGSTRSTVPAVPPWTGTSTIPTTRPPASWKPGCSSRWRSRNNPKTERSGLKSVLEDVNYLFGHAETRSPRADARGLLGLHLAYFSFQARSDRKRSCSRLSTVVSLEIWTNSMSIMAHQSFICSAVTS